MSLSIYSQHQSLSNLLSLSITCLSLSLSKNQYIINLDTYIWIANCLVNEFASVLNPKNFLKIKIKHNWTLRLFGWLLRGGWTCLLLSDLSFLQDLGIWVCFDWWVIVNLGSSFDLWLIVIFFNAANEFVSGFLFLFAFNFLLIDVIPGWCLILSLLIDRWRICSL